MNVKELIEELQACSPDAIAVNSDGAEIDSIEEDGDEVTLFTEDDEDADDEEKEEIHEIPEGE